jgi:hypothetical protein
MGVLILMDITDCSHKKPKFHRQVIAKYLYSLNYHIYELKQQAHNAGGIDEKNRLNDEVERLYNLKSAVLVKMIKEGFARIKSVGRSKKKVFCTVRLNRELTFHIPITEEVAELLRGEHGKSGNEPNIRTENPQDGLSAHGQGV